MNEVSASTSLAFDADLQSLTAAIARRLGLTSMPLLSLGGHDAKSLLAHCPSGIIFIPCQAGVSHSEAEMIDPESARNGAMLLADALWDLSNR